MMRNLVRHADERFGTNAAVRYFVVKVFPDHWSFYLGEFALYSFVLLIATGVWLTFVYVASPGSAYASVAALRPSTPIGYLMRQVHHWSAVTFVAAILIHMARIFFTAAFRKPRELNWVVGALMLILASLTGFTGYSLPYDALSGTGLRIADSVALSVPFIGRWAADALNGGAFPGPLLLPHLYTLHVYFMPVAIAGLLSLHMFLLIYQKHTQFVDDPAHVVGRRFWPDYTLRAVAAFALTVGVILVVASTLQINDITQYGPYHEWTAPNPAVPDWYAAFLDGGLRLGPAVEFTIFGHPIPAIFWPGVILPGLTVALILAWPWIDARFASAPKAVHDVLVPPAFAPARTGAGVAMIAAGMILTFAASDDQQAMAFHVPVETLVTIYRWLFPFGSIAAGLLAAVIAGEQRNRALLAVEREPERAVEFVRNQNGGYDERPVTS